ncbi:MAG: J domain-containing protein [Treponema sp.]|jgi:DnaJ like chaperone protein|nr:J domain-containing protein [Treponema sp.]
MRFPRGIRKFFSFFSGKDRGSPGKKFRRARLLLGLAAGGLAGTVVAGFAGLFIGLVMGYLLQELFGQLGTDRSAAAYLENPGRPDFNEGIPGLASWCALCVLIMGEENARNAAASLSPLEGQRAESFCRIAERLRGRLNPDLLAEALAARRRRLGDLPRLGKLLHSLACGEGLDTAVRIRGILDPGFRLFEQTLHHAAGRLFHADADTEASSWEILGLDPQASLEEVKSAYRRLAIRFHPDSVSMLSEKQQKEAARAFIRIQEAYQDIMSEPLKKQSETSS